MGTLRSNFIGNSCRESLASMISGESGNVMGMGATTSTSERRSRNNRTIFAPTDVGRTSTTTSQGISPKWAQASEKNKREATNGGIPWSKIFRRWPRGTAVQDHCSVGRVAPCGTLSSSEMKRPLLERHKSFIIKYAREDSNLRPSDS